MPFAGVPADRGLEDRGLAVGVLCEKAKESSIGTDGERPPSLGGRGGPGADLEEPAGSPGPVPSGWLVQSEANQKRIVPSSGVRFGVPSGWLLGRARRPLGPVICSAWPDQLSTSCRLS